MKVLLVEDEIDLGTALQRTLQQEKYIVDWVQDGAAAWDYLDNRQAQYTLAIFDWMLPGLTGPELCKRLRERQNSLPVLMLTARDRWEDKVMGLDEYFMKHPRHAATRDQILSYLYEVDTERISNVVAAQVRLLRRRLAELGCEDAIQTVPGGGYRLNPAYADAIV